MDEVKDTNVKSGKEQKEVETRPVAPAALRTLPSWFPWLIAGLAALLIAMIAYGLGYHMSRNGFDDRAGYGVGMMRGGVYGPNGVNGTGFRTRGMMNGAVGTVSAVSSSSITIKDTTRGGTVTYTIDGNTKVTEDGTTKAVSDIQTGNTVRVYATGSDTTVATQIVISAN